jgi:hypothetical protein
MGTPTWEPDSGGAKDLIIRYGELRWVWWMNPMLEQISLPNTLRAYADWNIWNSGTDEYWIRWLCELNDLRTRCWNKLVWMEKCDGLDEIRRFRTRCWDNSVWMKKYPTSWLLIADDAVLSPGLDSSLSWLVSKLYLWASSYLSRTPCESMMLQWKAWIYFDIIFVGFMGIEPSRNPSLEYWIFCIRSTHKHVDGILLNKVQLAPNLVAIVINYRPVMVKAYGACGSNVFVDLFRQLDVMQTITCLPFAYARGLSNKVNTFVWLLRQAIWFSSNKWFIR